MARDKAAARTSLRSLRVFTPSLTALTNAFHTFAWLASHLPAGRVGVVLGSRGAGSMPIGLDDVGSRKPPVGSRHVRAVRLSAGPACSLVAASGESVGSGW